MVGTCFSREATSTSPPVGESRYGFLRSRKRGLRFPRLALPAYVRVAAAARSPEHDSVTEAPDVGEAALIKRAELAEHPQIPRILCA